MTKQETIRVGLEAADQALADWVRTYAPEFCETDAVEAARERIRQRGTIAYIAEASGKVRVALEALDSPDEPEKP